MSQDPTDHESKTKVSKIFKSRLFAPIVPAIVGAIVSGSIVYMNDHSRKETTTLSELGQRTEFKKMLIDLDKVLIEHPELFNVFDEQKKTKPIKSRSGDKNFDEAQETAVFFMLMNIFDTAYTYYYRSDVKYVLTDSDRDDKEVITKWMKQLLKDSQKFRTFINDPKIQQIYPDMLMRQLNIWIQEI
jgi:F0F1-type ATP synthase delta subunit